MAINGVGNVADIETLTKDIVELQSQMAFQEHTVEALNEAIAAQQTEISLLKRQLELLKQRQDEQGPSGDQPGEAVADDRPPHY
ncbi:MAG: SlyX protein [Halioglobus sp.]